MLENGIIAIKGLAMAFGIASGVKSEAGIVTAVIPGFLISAIGGSRVVATEPFTLAKAIIGL